MHSLSAATEPGRDDAELPQKNACQRQARAHEDQDGANVEARYRRQSRGEENGACASGFARNQSQSCHDKEDRCGQDNGKQGRDEEDGSATDLGNNAHSRAEKKRDRSEDSNPGHDERKKASHHTGWHRRRHASRGKEGRRDQGNCSKNFSGTGYDKEGGDSGSHRQKGKDTRRQRTPIPAR